MKKISPSNRILVTGSKGQLGGELLQQGRRFGFDVVGIDIEELDITNIKAVETYFDKVDASVVINAAAYTAVDQAESEPELAFAVNKQGPANLATLCNYHGIPLIHISTDYVFDGTKNKAYEESDPVSPVGAYSHSKAQGEKEIIKQATKYIIIRTAWLYGVQGNNFVNTMLRLGRERKELKVVNDQKGCPTYAQDLAAAVLSICQQLQPGEETALWGIYHYCGKGDTTWYEFARKVFEVASKYEEMAIHSVLPISTNEYPTPAVRPANSVLDCKKIEKVFGLKRKPWEESLESMLKRLYTETNIGNSSN